MRHLYLIALILSLMVITSTGLAQDGDSGTLRIAAGWEGAEAEGFQVVLDLFTEQTGIEIVYELDANIAANVVRTGFLENPADIALLPRPGVIRQLANSSELIPLNDPTDPILTSDLLISTLSPNLIRLGSFNGRLFGLMITSRSKSTIWYRPDSFAEYDLEIPDTWDDLQAIADTYVADGIRPFALGGGDGWPLTDWFENIYVRLYGPSEYGQLFITEQITWDDPTVQATLSMMADMLLPYDERLASDADSILQIGHRDAVRQWLEGEAAMYYEGGFVRSYAQDIFPDLICGEDYSFFTFPSIDLIHAKPVVGGGQLAVMFVDSAEARAFMNFLVSEEGATAWVTAESGSIISPNLKVPTSAYRDECSALEAQQIQEASSFVFDGSDLTSGIFGEYALFTSLQDFLMNPAAVTQILEYLSIAADKS